MAEISSAPANQNNGRVRVKKMSTRIDMTPMVDLAFLLLTFFMLTTQLMDPNVIALQMPEKETPDTPLPEVRSERVVTLILGENNKIYWYTGVTQPQLNLTDYSTKGIRDVIRQKKEEINKLIVLVKPSAESSYQNLIDTLDEMDIQSVQFYLVKITPVDKDLVTEYKASMVALNGR